MTTLALRKRAQEYTEPERFTIVCAWCDRVRRGRDWRPERPHARGPRVSHGICPDCYRQQVERIGQRGGS